MAWQTILVSQGFDLNSSNFVDKPEELKDVMDFYTNQNKPKAQPKVDGSKPGMDNFFLVGFFFWLITFLSFSHHMDH